MTPTRVGPARRPSIQVVLGIAFLVVAGAAVACLSVFQYVWLTREEFAADLKQDLDLARSVKAHVERYMASRRQLIDTLAADLDAARLADPASLSRFLEVTNRQNPTFATLLVVDPRGVALAYSPATDAEGRPNVGRRFEDRRWFQDALRGERSALEVVVGRAQGRPTVGIAAPIRDGGRVIGVVAGGLSFDELRQSLRAAVPPDSGKQLVVVDSRARVVAHPSAAWEGRAHDLAASPVVAAAARAEEGTVDYVSDFSGDRRWAAFVRVPSLGWTAWTSRGSESLTRKFRSLALNLAGSGLAAILVAGVLALIVTRALARPLRELVDATQALAERRFQPGELRRLARSRVREFHELSTAFSGMAETLEGRYGELEARVAERTATLEQATREAQATAARLRAQEDIRRGYAELAALLNSLDRSYILQEAAHKIAASLQSPLVAVYLAEGGEVDGLKLKTYAVLDPAMVDAATLAPAGLPAEVARARVPRVVTPLLAGDERLRLGTGVGVLEVAAVAAFPLTAQERLQGVLVAALLAPLTDDIRSFLDSATRQLSVALANAGLYESLRYQSQELEALNEALRRASAAKSEFLASMSHELRTPLNSIIGFTEILLTSSRDPLADRQRSALQRVLTSGKHLLGLINDILDLAKIEAGRMDVQASGFDLAGMLRECLDTVEPAATTRGLALRSSGVDVALPVHQDRAKVKQIVLNLLSNAVKFTPAGTVELRVHAEPGRWIEVAVADTGIGIAPADHERVFESFHQVDSPEARAAGGTGLGLPISRRLAGMLGGRLTLQSHLGRGSVFTLRLPVEYGAEAAADPAAETVEPPPGVPRVLVIDDDRNVLEILRHAAAGLPVHVEGAATAASGRWLALTRRPALIVLDVMLQGQDDGWDVLRALKADPATRDIPVVVHSVIDNPHRARHLGAEAVLVKPAPPEAVKALFAGVLDLTAAT